MADKKHIQQYQIQITPRDQKRPPREHKNSGVISTYVSGSSADNMYMFTCLYDFIHVPAHKHVELYEGKYSKEKSLL